MKKSLTLKIVAGIALLFIVAWCSISVEPEIEIPKEKEVAASNVEVTGFINSYLKVVSGTYKFVNDGSDIAISVKLELIAKPTEKYYTKGSYPELKLNAIGSAGEIITISSYDAFKCERDEFKKVEDLLKGNVGDIKTVSFKHSIGFAREKAANVMTNANTFEIIDDGFTNEKPREENYSSNDSDSNSSDDSNAAISSSEWDDVLNDYDEYVDDYIKVMKKAANGDMDAIGESADLMQKAQSLGDKLENAKSSMNGKQINRFLKIQQKLANAVANM